MHLNGRLHVVAGLIGWCALWPGVLPAGGQGLPRTPWGDPDLQGMWTNIAEINVPFERPPELADTPELTEEQSRERTRIAVEHYDVDPGAFRSYVPSRPVEAPGRPTGPIGGPADWTERGSGTSRATSRVVDPPDGRLPPLTPDARQRRAASSAQRGRREYASWLDLGAWQRCITRGLPGSMGPTGYNANYAILQLPDYVVIQYEMIHDARIIPLDGRPHVDGAIRLWLGDPRGRWEGDTLVVETTNFNAEGAGAGAQGASGATVRLIERFTRVDADRIAYRATVDDPSTWTRPWTIASTLTRDDEQARIFEYACHEGNYAMMHTLSGARAGE